MHCDSCKQVKELLFNCEGCKKAICRVCGNLTASEIKCLQLKERILKFYCKQCLTCETFSLYQAVIQEKCNVIESKNKIIELLEQDIREMKQKLTTKDIREPLFSEVTKRRKEEVVVIKPKNETQKSTTTSQTVQEKIDPISLGVSVSKLKYVRNGGIAISYNSEKNIENVCKEIEEKVGEEYQVQKIEKKNPKIKVKSVWKKDVDDEEGFIEKLVLQNTIKTDVANRKIRIVRKYVPKRYNNLNKITVILELDTETYNYINKSNFLCIGWRTCKYEDYINVVQCFKCWKFGYMYKDCKSEKQVCAECAGEHRSCESETKTCVNCKYAAEVLKIPNIQINHPAYDKNCAAFKRIYYQLKLKVDFLENRNDQNSQ